MRIIDSHMHFLDYDRAEEVLNIMEQLKYEKINTLSLTDEYRVNLNPESLYLKSLSPKRVFCNGALDYTKLINKEKDAAKDLADQVDEQKKIGFDGMKMVEGKPTFYKYIKVPFDDKQYSPFFKRLEETKFPLVFHVGDPPGFWDPDDEWSNLMGWNYSKGNYISMQELMRQTDNVLKNNPNLTVIFAHFLFLADNLKKAEEYLEKYPNLHLDLTPGAELYFQLSKTADESRKFFIKWQDRILYGTDIIAGGAFRKVGLDRYVKVIEDLKDFFFKSGEIRIFREEDKGGFNITMEGLKCLDLPEETNEKIMHGNFEKLYGKEPKKINKDLAIKEANVIKSRSKSRPDTIKLINDLDKIIAYFEKS